MSVGERVSRSFLEQERRRKASSNRQDTKSVARKWRKGEVGTGFLRHRRLKRRKNTRFPVMALQKIKGK
jgi:hypothetical protein